MSETPKRPPRRKAEPAPTTPDPIEIAMEAEALGVAPGGVAYDLLTEQRRLIQADLKHRGWQIASERAAFALRLLIVAAGIGVVMAFGYGPGTPRALRAW